MVKGYWQFGTVALIVASAGIVAGCAGGQNNQTQSPTPMSGKDDPAPTPAQVARMIEPNVLGIACLYDPFSPWIWNTEHTQVKGVRIAALYLLGPNSTGVFGDGTIHPRMYLAYKDAQGKLDYKLIKEWSFDTQQAMPFRAKKRVRWGWGYGLFLPLGDMDLTGKDIRLTVSFERIDGLVITGNKKDFRIPAKPEKG
jgi:hypothetical protein